MLVATVNTLLPNNNWFVQTISILTTQPGTPLHDILNEKTFSEPRLAIFVEPKNPVQPHGVIIAERKVIIHFDDFTVKKGLLYLIAIYYVFYINYPKSVPASGLLLFIQEVLLGAHEVFLYKAF